MNYDNRPARQWVLVATVAMFLGAISRYASSEVITAQLPTPCLDFALAENSCTLAGIDPIGKKILFLRESEFDLSQSKSIIHSLPTAPIDLVYKRTEGDNGVFAVVCVNRQDILLWDATTLNPLESIAVGGLNPAALATSTDPNDPYLYYTFGRSHDSNPLRVINLETRKDVGQVVLDQDSHRGVSDVVISCDGRLAYPLFTGSPTGLSVWRLHPPDTEKAPFRSTQIYYKHEDVEGYLPEPYGTMAVCENVVYSPLLQEKMGELPFEAIAFMPNKPVVFGIVADQLVAVSTNTFGEIGRLALPDWPSAQRRAGDQVQLNGPDSVALFRRRPFSDQIFGDTKNSNVIVASNSRVWKIAFSSVVTTAEPYLAVTVEVPNSFAVGVEARVPIRVRDDRLTVEIANGPDGATLHGNELVWTPGNESVGETTIELRLSADGLSRKQSVSCRVTCPSIQLPFSPGAIRLFRDGSRAVVWTSSDDPTAKETFLAIVDLKQEKITASRTFLKPMSEIVGASDGVFCALRDSDAILVLNPENLTDHTTIYLNGRGRDLKFIGEEWLAVISSNGLPSYIQRPGFKAVGPDKVIACTRAFSGLSLDNRPVRRRDGWAVGGVLFDSELKSPRLLLEPSCFPTLVSGGSAGLSFIQVHPEYETSGWGRYLDRVGILGFRGRRIAQFQADATRILEIAPAAVSIRSEQIYNGIANVRTVSLTVRDLLDGAVAMSINLAKDTSSGQQRPTGGQPNDRLDVIGSRIAAIVDDRLFVVDLQSILLDKLPHPLVVQCSDDIISIARRQSQEIHYEAKGGSPPYAYELARELHGVKLDEATGVLTLEYDKIHDKAISEINRLAVPGWSGSSRGSAQENEPIRRFDFAKGALSAISGKPDDGVPIAVPIEILVRDATNDTAMFRHCVIIEIPDESISKAIAVPPRQQTVPNQIPSQTEVVSRLDAMEKRLARLESQIQEILNALDLEKPR